MADSYGAINALFSGLALGGVILAIFMQREELQLQREELAATRAELKRTAKAQESLSDTSDKQVQTLLLTAKLNALAVMVNHYASKTVFDSDHKRQMECANQIKELRKTIDGWWIGASRR